LISLADRCSRMWHRFCNQSDSVRLLPIGEKKQ
jgi:hypothetical protein